MAEIYPPSVCFINRGSDERYCNGHFRLKSFGVSSDSKNIQIVDSGYFRMTAIGQPRKCGPDAQRPHLLTPISFMADTSATPPSVQNPQDITLRTAVARGAVRSPARAFFRSVTIEVLVGKSDIVFP
jgi:hypothetical protein